MSEIEQFPFRWRIFLPDVSKKTPQSYTKMVVGILTIIALIISLFFYGFWYIFIQGPIMFAYIFFLISSIYALYSNRKMYLISTQWILLLLFILLLLLDILIRYGLWECFQLGLLGLEFFIVCFTILGIFISIAKFISDDSEKDSLPMEKADPT